MLSSEHARAFRDYYDAMRDSVLDDRTQTLVGVAAAMAVGCQP